MNKNVVEGGLVVRVHGNTVLGSWPKGCEFDPGSLQLLDERGSARVNLV